MDDIKTEYIGPKDGKGSRLRAYCKRGSISIPYPFKLGATERHAHVERLLREKLGRKEKAAADCFAPIVKAARRVIKNWSTGDLAAAVRRLDLEIVDYDKKRKAT